MTKKQEKKLEDSMGRLIQHLAAVDGARGVLLRNDLRAVLDYSVELHCELYDLKKSLLVLSK